jgi:glutamine---fructose-6-phosphate transaminase (isomerizing)
MSAWNPPVTNFELLQQDIERQAQLLQSSLPAIRKEAERVARVIYQDPPRIYLVGCGDSLNAGQAVRYVWERLLGKPVEAVPAMTFSRYAVDSAPAGSLVIAQSQSGNVNRVVEAVRIARERGLRTLAITGKRASPLAKEPTDDKLFTDFPKLGFVPGTTSYAFAMVVNYELAAALALPSPEAVALRKELEALPGLIQKTVAATQSVAEQHAQRIQKDTPILILGSGPQLANAHFTARKFFEITQSTALSQESEEYAHDEYSIVDSKYSVLLLAPPDRSFGRSLELARYLKNLGLHLAVATSPAHSGDFHFADLVYPIAETPTDLLPVPYAIPSEWLCYTCAVRIGGSFYATADQIHDQDGDPQIYQSEVVTH